MQLYHIQKKPNLCLVNQGWQYRFLASRSVGWDFKPLPRLLRRFKTRTSPVEPSDVPGHRTTKNINPPDSTGTAKEHGHKQLFTIFTIISAPYSFVKRTLGSFLSCEYNRIADCSFRYCKCSKISTTGCLPKRPRQTAQTQIRLLLKESDLGLLCLQFWQVFCECQQLNLWIGRYTILKDISYIIYRWVDLDH